MRVLVTGGAGFVGRHLLRVLEEGGGEIFATALDPIPPRTPIGEADPVQWLQMDVTSDASIEAALREARPDVIYHLAGQASVGESFENPIRTWEVNALGTVRLLSVFSRCGITPPRRVLLASSAEVYGYVAERDQPIVEDAPVRPATPYGASKAAAEIAVLQQGRSLGTDVVIARSFNSIGPGQDGRFVLPSIARQLAEIRRGEAAPIVRVGNLDVVRDFLDVRDVVRAYTRLMEAGEGGGAWNICSGQGRSLASVLSRLVDLSRTGARLETDPERMRSVDIPALIGDPSAMMALEWSPQIPLDRTLEDLLAEGEKVG